MANARMPTEKAHGHSAVKLCGAFAKLGVSVELWHPRRHQPDPSLRGRSVFDFYGVEPTFVVRTLRNIDIVRVVLLLPRGLYRVLFAFHSMLWGAYVGRLAVRRPADVYVTTDTAVAWWLARLGLPTVLDVHAMPAGLRRRLTRGFVKKSGFRSIVALTEGNRRRMIEIGVPDECIVVAGSGVDIQQYKDLPNQEECRTMHNLPLDRPIIGYVGRFQTFGQDKGVSELILAMGLLKPRLDRLPLLLCVGGPMEVVPGYTDLAGEVGLSPADVLFVDHVPAVSVPTWIRSLDVGAILFPPTEHMSHFTSPLKMFEYLAAGVPVVASDLPTLREAAGPGADVVFVSGSDPVEEAAAAIESFLARPKNGGSEVSKTPVPTWEDRASAILSAAGFSELEND